MATAAGICRRLACETKKGPSMWGRAEAPSQISGLFTSGKGILAVQEQHFGTIRVLEEVQAVLEQMGTIQDQFAEPQESELCPQSSEVEPPFVQTVQEPSLAARGRD